jgi:hypothetical protein
MSKRTRWLLGALIVCVATAAWAGYEGGVQWSLWDIPAVLFGGIAIGIVTELAGGGREP